MKKIVSSALMFFLVFSLLASAMPAARAESAAEQGITINVFNWGQYISDGTDGYIDVNKAFTEATGIEVNYMTFDSNESLYTKLKTGGSSYDVIIPSDYMVGRLISEGMLLELDFNNIPNYQFIDEAYKNTSYDPDNKYSVPYTWGATGVIYNSKFVNEADIGSWDLLWNKDYAGKILMFDNPRDSFGIAELLLGFGINTADEAELKAAAEKLSEQKPVLQNYVMDQIYNQMIHEEAWIAPYYAGDYMMMSEDNENLKFFYPKEGFNLFIDAMCIPTSCSNKAAAEAYINFVCSPEISSQNLTYLGYSAPSTAAKELMDKEVIENEIIYPPAETVALGQSFLNLPIEATRLMDELWLNVKTADSESSGNYAVYIGLGAVVVLVAALLVYRSAQNKKRKARRGGSAS